MSDQVAAVPENSLPDEYGRDFRLYVTGRVVSVVGDRIAKIALVFLVIRLAHGFAPAVSLYYVAQLAPGIVGGLLAGVAADQVDRRRLMVGCDVGRAMLVGLVPLAVTVGLWMVFPLVVILYTLTLLFDTTAGAAVPDLVAPARLTGANSILSGIDAAADFAYAVGGALIFVFGYELPFYFDAASFLFSAGMLWAITIPSHSRGEKMDVRGIVSSISEGITFLVQQPFLKWSVAALGIGALAGGMGYVLTPLYASRVLARSSGLAGPLHGGAFRFSVLEVALGVGLLVASGVASRLERRFPGGALFGAGLSVFGVAYALLAWCHNLYLAVALLFVAGVANGMFVILGFTLLRRLTPSAMRGRVSGATATAINTSLVAGSALGGALLLLLPFSVLWLLLGGIVVLSSLLVWLNPAVRSTR